VSDDTYASEAEALADALPPYAGRRDPTDTWHETMGLSTARQLSRAYDELAAARAEIAGRDATLLTLQKGLHASQADLTSMEAKRDQAIENGTAWQLEYDRACAERDALAVLNAELKAEAFEMRAAAERAVEREQYARRELATANRQNRILTAENEAALRRLNETEA
jgi:hypothetical protein